MKRETYIYDEGYGFGPREIYFEGMTVNDIIEKLQDLANQGYGDRIVFNDAVDSVEFVGLKDFYWNDEEEDFKAPYIY